MKLNELPLEIVNYISQFLAEEQDWRVFYETCRWCREACLMDVKKRKHHRRFYIGKKFKFDYDKYKDLMIYNIEIKGGMGVFPKILYNYMYMSGEFMLPKGGSGWRKYCYFQNKDEALPFNLLLQRIRLTTPTPTILRFECEKSNIDENKYYDIIYTSSIGKDAGKVNDNERYQHIQIGYGCMKFGFTPTQTNLMFIINHYDEMEFIYPTFLCYLISHLDEFMTVFWGDIFIVEKLVIPETYDWAEMPYPNTYLKNLEFLKKDIQEEKVSHHIKQWIENESGWFGIEKFVDKITHKLSLRDTSY